MEELRPTQETLNPVPGIDRRSLYDRRQVHSVDYFLMGGIERRKIWSRRKNKIERRENWVRITEWTSVFVPL
ncbi:MAG: hypothetical protein V3S66_05420 [Desulfobacterales bacterium]